MQIFVCVCVCVCVCWGGGGGVTVVTLHLYYYVCSCIILFTVGIFYCRCPPPEFHKLLDSIIRKQGIFHPTDKGNGVCVCVCVCVRACGINFIVCTEFCTYMVCE